MFRIPVLYTSCLKISTRSNRCASAGILAMVSSTPFHISALRPGSGGMSPV